MQPGCFCRALAVPCLYSYSVVKAVGGFLLPDLCLSLILFFFFFNTSEASVIAAPLCLGVSGCRSSPLPSCPPHSV